MPTPSRSFRDGGRRQRDRHDGQPRLRPCVEPLHRSDQLGADRPRRRRGGCRPPDYTAKERLRVAIGAAVAMLIAFLVVLGVDLAIIVGFVVLVVGRRRWVKRQARRVLGRDSRHKRRCRGSAPRWKRGYGRWVRDVLVWTKTPFYFRNELVPVDGVTGERAARHGEVKRLKGDEPAVVEFASGKDKVEVAARAEHQALVTVGVSRLGA